MISISRIEASIVEMPLVKPLIVSFGAITHASSIIVRIFDKDGNSGFGETSMTAKPVYKPEYTASVWATLTDAILPFLSGKTFESVMAAEASLAFIRGNYFAKAAVSMALFELQARKSGENLVKIAGGARAALDISRTVSLHADPAAALAEAEQHYAAGTRWIKLKIGPGRDIRHLELLKSRLPGDIKLMADANAGYDYNEETVSLFRDIDKLQLFSIEQPLRWNDIVFHASLQRQMKTDLALDESMDDAYIARQALEIGACRGGNIKLARVGGYGEALKIEQLFRAAGFPVWIGGMMETPVGFHHNLVAATLPGCTLPIDFLEAPYMIEGFFDYFTTSLYTIENGQAHINASSPGLGLSLDERRLKEKTRTSAVF